MEPIDLLNSAVKMIMALDFPARSFEYVQAVQDRYRRALATIQHEKKENKRCYQTVRLCSLSLDFVSL